MSDLNHSSLVLEHILLILKLHYLCGWDVVENNKNFA